MTAEHAVFARSQLSAAQVSEAKPVIRAELLEAGDAIAYSEPERAVTSRSGDDCVVALTDQWYIIYGEPEWEAATQCAGVPTLILTIYLNSMCATVHAW
jgi:leucyl-tRNA synthetase